ncbi:uncharacterized protein METZ01_LOCUS481863, partial [marine metagenome]
VAAATGPWSRSRQLPTCTYSPALEGQKLQLPFGRVQSDRSHLRISKAWPALTSNKPKEAVGPVKNHRLLRQLTWDVFVVAFIPALILAAFLPGKRHSTGIFGSFPALNFKYWSQALNQIGIPSMTIVDGVFSINSPDDFDRMIADFAWSGLPLPIRRRLGGCIALLFVLRCGSVLHTPFSGFAFSGSSFWRLESWLLRRARIPVVILPVGFDIYMYSRILDPSIRYGLLADYP